MELEPVRRLGFALDQATLKQIALNNGIEESFTNMSQAEKAQLRYIALMTQIPQVQGDMARTLNIYILRLNVEIYYENSAISVKAKSTLCTLCVTIYMRRCKNVPYI